MTTDPKPPAPTKYCPGCDATQGDEVSKTSTRYETGADTWLHGDRVSLHDCFPGRLWGSQRFGWSLGPCDACGSRTVDYGGRWACISSACANGIHNGDRDHVAPSWWNCHINVFKDGNAWCATGPGFTNIQESACGFGDSPAEAVSELGRAMVDGMMGIHDQTMSIVKDFVGAPATPAALPKETK